MWDYCGMERSEEGLRKALTRIGELKDEFWSDIKVLGGNDELDQALERAGRVADFFELGELMCIDALVRHKSAAGTSGSKSNPRRRGVGATTISRRSAWEFAGENHRPILHKEPLVYDYVEMKQRSYK